jgi:hypothetical protein
MPIKGRRPIEGECRRRLVRGEARLQRRLFNIAGAAIVFEQRLAVVGLPRHQRCRHATVDLLNRRRRDSVGHNLTNTIVVGFDAIR